MSTIFVLLLLFGTALAATHVNISIAQHPAINPADVTYVDGMAPAELRAGPTNRLAKLRVAEEGTSSQQLSEQQIAETPKQPMAEQRNNVNAPAAGFVQDGRAVRVQQGGNARPGHFQQQHTFIGRTYHSGKQGQYRQPDQQDRQNQEFERYIQSYHSGPTVETVFESASPVPQRYQSAQSAVTSTSTSTSTSSSSSAGPQRVVTIAARPAQKHTFERQIALPSVAPSESSATDKDQTQTIASQQPQFATNANVQSAPSSSVSTAESASSSGASAAAVYSSGNQFDANNNAPSSFNQANFEQPTAYSKPSYEQSNYNYNEAQQPSLANEYPPSVDESQNGYAGFYGAQEQPNFYAGQGSYPSAAGYLPTQNVYQRPVVTKTIQIAQPALKAKKYEVRHPAIQKEFYDIEERVIIKPAGTIVVELERPVAKIPKGETILPLGHPHPAIAGEYENNGQSAIHTESSSAGSYSSAAKATPTSSASLNPSPSPNQNHNHNENNAYGPPPVYAARQGLNQDGIRTNTLGSTVTTTPTYDHNTKSDFVEANLKRQYGGEMRFVAATENSFNAEQPRKELFSAANTHGNQRQIPSKNLSPNMFSSDETNFNRASPTNNVAPTRTQYANDGQNAFNYNAPQLQNNYNNGNDEFKGEYITGNFYNTPNNQQDAKPARLQEQPAAADSASVAKPHTHTHIIKHEHNIHLPPTQHNIYLGQLEQGPAPVASVAPSAPLQQQQQQFAQQQSQQQSPSAQLNNAPLEEEAARVQEIKPFLQQHRGPVVMYANTPARAAHTSQRYTQPAPAAAPAPRRQQQVSAQRSFAQFRYGPETEDQPEYSAPYSNMRYLPQESSRLTAEPKFYANEAPAQRTVTVNYNRGPETKANLIAQAQPAADNNNQQSNKAEMRPHTHIQIQIPHRKDEAGMPIMVSSTISPPMDQPQPAAANIRQQSFNSPSSKGGANEVERFNGEAAAIGDNQEYADGEPTGNSQDEPDCEHPNQYSARYENAPQAYNNPQQFSQSAGQQKFMRLIETPSASAKDAPATPAPVTNIQPENVDVNVKSTAGHVATGSRVIAATPAPTDASAASESFHKRRIVVNHPFQTVREVVEHEPITNYHQIQVNEPASPALYHQAYYQPSAAIRQVPVFFHATPVTHGRLQYALPDAIPVHEQDERDVYQQQRRV